MEQEVEREIRGNPIRFVRNDDQVTIVRPDRNEIMFTTYIENCWDEITNELWRLDSKGYPVSSRLGYLHVYIMGKWYGEKAVEEFKNKGYVIDHISNEHNDCRLCNLEFLKQNYNTAKGQQLDKDMKRLRRQLALAIYKDHETGNFQITIGCNEYICGHDRDGNEYAVDSFKLLYGGDYNRYPIVLSDAEGILLSYEQGDGVILSTTKAACVRVYHALQIELTEEEKEQAVVTRFGNPFIVIGNGKTYIEKLAPDKDWKIPDDYDGDQQFFHRIPHWVRRTGAEA